MADMLSAAKEPVNKTALMYSARMSFAQLNPYLNYLVDKQLIESEDGKWVITNKGRVFLSMYQLVAQIIA